MQHLKIDFAAKKTWFIFESLDRHFLNQPLKSLVTRTSESTRPESTNPLGSEEPGRSVSTSMTSQPWCTMVIVSAPKSPGGVGPNGRTNNGLYMGGDPNYLLTGDDPPSTSGSWFYLPKEYTISWSGKFHQDKQMHLPNTFACANTYFAKKLTGRKHLKQNHHDIGGYNDL